MTQITITHNVLSEIFWKMMFTTGAQHIAQAKLDISTNNIHFENLRNSATYNTGSIPLSSAITLVMLANYFRPSLVAEVGTFIGRSTFSLALGSYLGGVNHPSIHTCDFSNDIELDFNPTFKGIVQYRRKSSSEMFSSLLSNNLKPELYFIDGRLQDDDLSILSKLGAQKSIIILDDFEGVEKGVVNAFKLTAFFKDNFVLIYPPTAEALRGYGIDGWSTIAALVPRRLFSFQ